MTDRAIVEWRPESRFYRRRPGRVWLLAVLVVPALLALIGWGLVDEPTRDEALAPPTAAPSASVAAPAPPTPTSAPATVPSPPGSSDFSIVRTPGGFALGGELPDEATRASLVDALRLTLPGARIDDHFTVTPGAGVPDPARLGGVFSATSAITDFRLELTRGTITLTGVATTERAKADASDAAAAAWPGVPIRNDIRVKKN